MSRFEYRLELPLRVARVRLGERRRLYAEALRTVIVSEREVEETTRQVQSALEDRDAGVRRGISGAELAQLTALELRAKARLPRLRERRSEARAQLERARAALSDVSREVQVLEKQRESKRVEHVREADRHEQKVVDDIVIQRKARESFARRRATR